MVFTSGTVDERPTVASDRPQYCHLLQLGWAWWRGTWACGGAGGFLTHCWALRDQAGGLLRERGPAAGFVAPFPAVAPVGVVVGLVGVLFEIWIVDASI